MEKVSSPKSSVCVVYGSEDYHLDTFVAMARTWPNRVLRQFDAGSLTESDVLNQCADSDEGLPVTVLIDNAERVKESKTKSLRSYLDKTLSTDLSVVIVAVVRDSKLPELWEYAGAKGKVFHFQKFGPWDNDKILEYIHKRAITYAISFDTDADTLFFRMTGGDLHRINSEFRKLAALASVTGNYKMTRQVLASVVAPNFEARPKDIAEAAFDKNKKKAMGVLSLLFETEGESASSVMVSAALIRELQSTIVARHLLDKGSTPEYIAEALEMKPWPCKKYFLPRVHKHDQKALAGYMTRLCKLDSDVKSGSTSKRTLVELAVLSIAA